MPISARTLELIMSTGCPPDTVLELVRSIDADMAAQIPHRDEMAEKRRLWDRERKRRERGKSTGNSTGQEAEEKSVETGPPDLGSPPSPSPQTPHPRPPVQVPTHTRARAAAFAEFWAGYPRKVGKPKAESAYFRALGRAGGFDPAKTIFAGLQAHVLPWSQIEAHLVPHPTTWLNRDGWNDTPPTPDRGRHDRAPSAREHKRIEVGENLGASLGGAERAARNLRS